MHPTQRCVSLLVMHASHIKGSHMIKILDLIQSASLRPWNKTNNSTQNYYSNWHVFYSASSLQTIHEDNGEFHILCHLKMPTSGQKKLK
jgi:hypothetical protein